MIIENMAIKELINFVKERCYMCIKSVPPFKEGEHYAHDSDESGLWVYDDNGISYDLLSDEGYHVWSKAFIKEDE